MPADGWRRGALSASVPLLVLVTSVSAGVIVTSLARWLTAGLGFFTQQTVTLTVLAGAGVLALAAYAIACRRVLRRIRAWQLAERRRPADAAMATLCVTAMIVLLPALLLGVLPQHPAP
jgi:hypothetical protein